VKQQYDFTNKVPKAPIQSVAQPEKPVEAPKPVVEAAAAAAAAAPSNDQQEAKDKKEKKKKPAKE
ncbi:unnamed protein product, partial [Rotaria socialis]